jgi:glycine cleavage system transcriptional repressor
VAVDLLVTILGPDRVGVVAQVAGRLYEQGGNLGDVAFSVLGASFEFSAAVEMPDGTEAAALQRDLAALPALQGATVTVQPFKVGARHGESGRVTHRLQLSGGDQPGLIARVAEALAEYEANIVRMTSERVLETSGASYVIRFDVAIPAARAPACLSAIGNTAAQLQMSFHYETAR